MDNDAFRALVRDRAKVKSTKEIAREAVEAEFKRGKKKRRRNGDSSGSDDDNDDRRKHKKGGERRGRGHGDEDNDDKDAASNSNYRDRAKERREGKIDSTTMTKELDKFTSGSTPTPVVPRKAAPTKKKERLLADAMPTLEEAEDRLHKFNRTASSQSKLGISSGLSAFIRLLSSRLPSAPSASNPRPPSQSSATAKAIQRSRLVMSVDCVANDYRRAWQIPREIAHPTPNFDKYFRPRLDLALVARIEKVVTAKKRLSMQSIKVQSFPNKDDNDNDNNNAIASPSRNNNDSTDSDDDIFGGVGI